MGMLDTFPKAFETYWPGLGGIDLLVGLAGAAGVYLSLIHIYPSGAEQPEKVWSHRHQSTGYTPIAIPGIDQPC